MKILLTILLLLSSLYALKIQQADTKFTASGGVVDILYDDGKLYAATDASSVDIFDINTTDIIDRIMVDKITDFMGDVIDSKVYSVDKIGNKILILSQAKKGARRIHIYQDGKMELVIPYTQRLFIAKAKFIDENTILLGLLSNEIISFDIKERKTNYRVQVSQSKFSNFALNEDKTEVVVADESGNLKIHNTKDGSLVEEFAGQNLDNVFQVDYKNGIIATAGQDRRAVIYTRASGSAYYKTSNFLIYSVGLSPSATLAGFASDENNNITIFNTRSQKEIGKFGGNKMTLTNILFLDETRFFGASDDKTINLYKIK